MENSTQKGFGSVVSILPGRVIVLQTLPGTPSSKATAPLSIAPENSSVPATKRSSPRAVKFYALFAKSRRDAKRRT